MDIKQLYYFVTIADEGSISGAARKLFMSQPPLSNQIKLLEKELDCTLFERGSRNIHLTDAGQTLYNYAVSLLKLSEIAKKETIISAKNQNQTLRIGIVSSVICSNALKWITDFSKLYPEINFEIVEGNTYELLQKFQTNLIHIAILRTPFDQEHLQCIKIFSDNLISIGKKEFFSVNNSKECLSDNSTTLKELSTCPLIIYRRWENIIKEYFNNKKLPMSVSCVNDDARTTLYFVESGMGIGIVPESALSIIKSDDIIHKKIADINVASDVVLVYNEESYLPDCSKTFIHYINSII